MHILRINEKRSIDKYDYIGISEEYEDRLKFFVTDDNQEEYISALLGDAFKGKSLSDYNYEDYMDTIEQVYLNANKDIQKRIENEYKNKFHGDEQIKRDENVFEFTKYNNKVYKWCLDKSIQDNTPISEYRFSIYDDNNNLIDKNIQLCNSDTIFELYLDESEGMVPARKERHICKNITEMWFKDETVHEVIKTNVYYKKLNNGKYEMYSVDGKSIIDDIDDYIINTRWFFENENKYTLKINGEWVILDENFNIVARNINPVYNAAHIIYTDNGVIVQLEKDLGNDLYDNNGLIFKNTKSVNVEKGKYLNVVNAFNYGLIDTKGNWIYKYSVFDTLDDAYDLESYLY